MSAFDPVQFMNATFEGSNATKVIPPPIGEYSAQIDKVEYSPQLIKKGNRAGQTMHKVNLFCKLMAPGIDEADGKLVRHEIILEMTENGSIDMGKDKNVKLGKLREALGMNDKAFSFAAMQGQMLKLRISHDVDLDNDPTGETVYARVAGVAKLS